MSITCPKCGTDIDQDFGLVNCPGCSTVLAVDVEGNVQIPVPEQRDPESASGDLSVTEEGLGEPVDESNGEPIHEAFNESLNESSNEAVNESVIEAYALDPVEEASVGTEDFSAASEEPAAFVQNADFHAESFEDNEASSESTSAPEPLPSPTVSDLSDIEKFGNSDSSSGPLTYTLVIEGIDAGAIRKAVLDALDAVQFEWDVKDVSKNIHGGKLVLSGLAVAQAVMAVRCLRGIKVRLSWQQHLYSEAGSSQ